jgi:eukaryotic-like serine/threonine-protein kinase
VGSVCFLARWGVVGSSARDTPSASSGADSELGPVSADDALTVGGVDPPALATGQADTPAELLERAALQRARADLLGVPYEPVRLGRFVLLERLGAGGMGVVYAGYDSTLDRKLAIKLISPERASNEQARRRLFREAQAMAKLSHPNVVQVFEAGEDQDRLFVAMEYVEGKTLRQWLRDDRERSWREIISLFLEIGAGLEAAHAAGIVHRDFKPDNVLVGTDGRPKVADFGVAALDLASSSLDGGELPSASVIDGVVDASLTRTGEIMGTPAYMSPEHTRGRATDARSDQFSFCVVLHEALYGERPFGGSSSEELMHNISKGRLRPAPQGVSVPGWIRAAILQGMSSRPEHRHASMGELLRVLGTDPRARVRRVVGTIAFGAAILGAGAMLAGGEQGPKACTEGEQRLAGVWDAERKQAMRDAIGAVDVSYGPDTNRRVEALLDAYAQTWVTEYRDACEATRVRGDQTEHAMDLRMACLARAKTALAATVSQLARADASTVERAIRIAGGLPRLERCGDLEALQAEVPGPDDPAVASAVEEIRAQRADAMVLHAAGKPQEADALLEELRRRAEALDYLPVQVEIETASASVMVTLGRLEEAEQVLERALSRALAEGITKHATDAASSLTLVVGERRGRFDEARWIGDVALGLARHDGDPWALARVHTHLGGMLLAQGRLDEAESELRQALELLERVLGPDDPGVATGLENLGMVMSDQYAHEEAEALHRRAHEIRLRALGPEHPEVALSHANVATALTNRGKLVEAETEHRRALALFERAYGPDHPDVGMSWTNLGITLDRQGRHLEAEEAYRRALAVVERVYGPKHAHVASVQNNLGASLQDQQRLEEAEAAFRAALDIYEAALGPAHPHVGLARTNVGLVLEAQGHLDEAIVAHRQALEAVIAALPREHPDVAIARMYLGTALTEARAYEDAETHLEEALEILAASEASPDHVARASFGLARTLVARNRDRARAISLAEEAAEIWKGSDERPRSPSRLAEVQAWLAEPSR